MTAFVSFGAFLVLCVVACKVATRMGDAADELKRRRPMPPVITERYERTVPPPLTTKQLANLKDRRARMDAREYRERPYMN